MITGIDTGLSQDFLSKYDAEPKTIWKIGVLSAYAFAYVGSRLSDQTKSIEGMIDVVKFGLLGFENFKDKSGKEIRFETEEKAIGSHSFRIVTDKVISAIPIDILIELGGKILEITKLTEQEIKN
jgi:hypothetical protein